MDFLSHQTEPETETKNEDELGEEFLALLDDYALERPRRGQILEGEIIRVEDDMVLVDVGAKRDAVVPRTDLSKLDDQHLENLSSGDQIPVYVLRTPVGDEDLLVSINKGLVHEDWQRAVLALESGDVHELEVKESNRGGLLVEFGQLRGFVPNSHVPELRRMGNREMVDTRKQELIGSSLLLKVIEVDADRRRLILSARAARAERRLKRLEELEPGQVVKGHVVNLVEFGAFVNLGGIDGLLHKSEMGWHRVDNPAEVLNKGDEIEVLIKDIDRERERISLSRKALLPNPWEQVAEHYQESDLVEGKVTNVQEYGAFVQIPEGVEGLVHVSEINLGDSGSPTDVVHPGDTVLARVLEVTPDEGRMGLSLRQVTKEEQLTWMVDQWEKDKDSDQPAAEASPLAIEEDDEAMFPLPEEPTDEQQALESPAEAFPLPEEAVDPASTDENALPESEPIEALDPDEEPTDEQQVLETPAEAFPLPEEAVDPASTDENALPEPEPIEALDPEEEPTSE